MPRAQASSLSNRGARLVGAPTFEPHIKAHFERAERAFDAEARPDGYVALSVAENKRVAGRLAALLQRYHEVPPHVLGYDAPIGNLELRRELAAFMARSFLGRAVEPEQIVALAGAGSVLEVLFYGIADAGEGVLVPTPSYSGFWADLEVRDALRIVPAPRLREDGFRLDPEMLERALRDAQVPVRAMILTSPDNPLGHVYTADELRAILDWAEDRGLHVVLDEIYALSVFGERPFVSGASLRPTLGERRHVVWGFSKDFGASGLRCGVLVSENEEVLRAVGELAYWSMCSGHTQHLLTRLLADREAVDGFVAAMRADLRGAYGHVVARLNEEGLAHVPAEAGLFVLCDLREHLSAPTREAEEALWRRILEEADVNLTPGAACRIEEPGFFRLCYAAQPDAALRVAIERIGRCLRDA